MFQINKNQSNKYSKNLTQKNFDKNLFSTVLIRFLIFLNVKYEAHVFSDIKKMILIWSCGR